MSREVSVFVLAVLSLVLSRAPATYAGFDQCSAQKTTGVGKHCGGFMNVAGNCSSGLRCVYRLGSTYGEYRTGLCETELCAVHMCGYRQRCRSGRGCVCPAYNCTGKRNHVCAHDGETYRSICHLQKEECARGYYIGIKSKGRCPQTNYSSGCEKDEMGNEKKKTVKNQGCWHLGRVYRVGEKVEMYTFDRCLNSTCTNNGSVSIMEIPGCGAGPDEEYVAVEEPAVPGKWTSWSLWSSCWGDCCNTTRNRTRSCTPPQNEGRKCKGSEVLQVERCYPERCCRYSKFSPWSSCSVTCNRGVQTRTRNVSSEQNPLCCEVEETRECRNYIDIYPAHYYNHWRVTPLTQGPEIATCHDGPCQLHHLGKDHLFEDSDCHSYCKFNISVCGGACSDPGNCSCRPTKAKELQTFAYCPWGKGLDPLEPTYRWMPFLIPLECGCVGCTADDGSETNDTYAGPSIVDKEVNDEHPCPS